MMTSRTLTILRQWLGELLDAFSPRTQSQVLTLLAGAVLAPGRRTVTSDHRVLNRNAWSSRDLARRLLILLVRAVAPDGPIILGLDDTLERRRGAKIKAKGIYRDPVRSSHSHFVKASGLRWLSLMLLAPVPFAGRVWALPFFTVLAPSERYHRERGARHKPLLDWGRQMLLQAHRWLPDRRIVAVTDMSFAALEFLGACTGTSASLPACGSMPISSPRPGQIPRCKGERLPKLEERLTRANTPWQRWRVADWYGEGERVIEAVSGTAVWFHNGLPVVPIRWVLVRDPAAKFDPQAFLCTDPEIDPEQILTWFVRRWRLEVTFEEARAHLGLETQRQWSDQAIARTAPTLLALFSLITLWANDLWEQTARLPRQASWYAKSSLTFSDAIAAVRYHLWWAEGFATSRPGNEVMKVPRALFERLTDTLCYAA